MRQETRDLAERIDAAMARHGTRQRLANPAYARLLTTLAAVEVAGRLFAEACIAASVSAALLGAAVSEVADAIPTRVQA